MKKTDTLKKNYEFKNMLSKGTYYGGDVLTVFIKKNNEKNKNFIGIAIGVKTGKAVKRNRVKRLIRENYRLNEERISTGYTILFLLKKNKDINLVTFENIKKDMNKIFTKANLFIEDKEEK